MMKVHIKREVAGRQNQTSEKVISRRKSFISKNISSSEASSNEDSEEEVGEALFMAFEEEKSEMK